MEASSSASAGPFSGAQRAWVEACDNLGSRWQGLAGHLEQQGAAVRDGVVGAVRHLHHASTQHQRRTARINMLASLSVGGALGGRKAQQLFELAYNPSEMRARLSVIPVYTVANKDSREFVLVSGVVGDSVTKQLGLFFFSETDAQALVHKIKEQSPELGRQSKVLKVGMDKVYDLAIAPREGTPAEGVTFRFMPNAQQVQSALRMYQEEGIEVKGFTGVPIFQAEGLTVKTDRARYTPLFFSKADLDAAVGNAYTQRESDRAEATRSKSDKANQELSAAQAAFDASTGKQRKTAQLQLDKARGVAEKYSTKLAAGAAAEKPKIEVGCLEEVLEKMEKDAKGEWGNVMFIPSGAISMIK